MHADMTLYICQLPQQLKKKKNNTLLPKYITCSNISQNWARREPLKANIALYAVQKGKQKQR